MTGLISLAALGALVLLARRPTSLVADQPALDDRSALRVQCLASRYAWSFRYAGSDGEFGTIDDIVHPQLVVPHRGRIVLQLRSNDVLHGLAIPRLGLRRTVVPGLTVTLAFDLPPEPATRTAHSACAWPLVYEIACSELCGTSHHRMRSELVIHDTPGFARWLAAARASREPPATTVPAHPPANPSPVNLPTAHPARDTVLVDSTARTNWGWPWPASR
jgi:heme/copper-type cytochrome/quinol oxidase subunit 2